MGMRHIVVVDAFFCCRERALEDFTPPECWLLLRVAVLFRPVQDAPQERPPLIVRDWHGF